MLADTEARVGLPWSAWPGPDRYPTADAVDLVRTRHVQLRPDGTLAAHEQVVTKILTERGKGHGQVTIPFDTELQRVELRWAQTIRPDGTVVPVPKGTRNPPLLSHGPTRAHAPDGNGV